MAKKRVIPIVICLGIVYLYAIFGVFSAGRNTDYLQAVGNQSMSQIELYRSRGTIYDCNLNPLTNLSSQLLAVAMPMPEGIMELRELTKAEIDAQSVVREGKPLALFVPKAIQADAIDFFTVPKRYADDGLCTNLLGYVDGAGRGVTGCEKAFDDILSRYGGQISLDYTIDALGRMIVGEKRQYTNTVEGKEGGVALTVDSGIQQAAEEAAQLLDKGAVVVASVPDCKIKAVVSAPGYNQNRLEEGLNGEDSPMINRAFSAYTPGSVFKLVVATAALNSGDDGKAIFNCSGSTMVDGMSVACYGGKAHGNVNLHTALQKSCNCYFIHLANRVSTQVLYETAMNFGFGTPTRLYTDLISDSGILPSGRELDSRRKIANFSIGQGDLTVTPLQVAAMINTIVSEGIYRVPQIYEGEVNYEKELLPSDSGAGSVPVMEALVALRLKSYLESAAKFGTARDGAPQGVLVGAKTGTAQTGVIEGGQELLNYWYAGYTGRENDPEYVIVVLQEGAQPDNNPTPEIFKKIAEFLTADQN